MLKEKKYFGHFEYLKGLLTIDRTIDSTNISLCKLPLFKQEERKTKIVSHFLGIHVHSIKLRNFIKLPVKEVFFQHINPDDTFSRLDIIVSLLAIENEKGLNDFGWNLYTKLQTNLCSKEQAEIKKTKFKEFISLYLDNHSLPDEPLVINENLKIVDNAQQLALSIFCKEKDMIVEVKKKMEAQNTCDRLSLIASDFSIQELKAVEDRLLHVKNEVDICQLDAFLWPPVLSFFDEITNKMSLLYNVRNFVDIPFDERAFARFIKAIYHFDEVAEWKIDKKIGYMKPFFPKKVRCLTLEAPHPVFCFKNKKNRFSFLRNIVKMKNAIRKVYQSKIENYHFDIITHSADNTTQSEYMNDVIYSNFDFYNLLKTISQKEVLISGIKQVQDLEDIKAFPFGKDIAIICKKKNLENVISKIKDYLANHLNKKYTYKIINKNEQCDISLFAKDNLLYEFSVYSAIPELNEKFICNSFSKSTQIGNIFVPNSADEDTYRKIIFSETK